MIQIGGDLDILKGEHETKIMIKIKSKLLIFDKCDRMRNIFPKDCAVTIPEYIPITDFNSAGPDNFKVIGHVVSHIRNNREIAIEAEIDFKDEELLKELITKDGVYVGGYYRVNKSHMENELRVIDDITLRSVGLYFSDVFGDDNLKVEVME